MKTNKSMQKSEYCDEAAKCDLNENTYRNNNFDKKINAIDNDCNGGRNNNNIVNFNIHSNNDSNKNLVEMHIKNETCFDNLNSKLNKEYDCELKDRMLEDKEHNYEKIHGKNYKYNDKKINCTNDCDNAFSPNIKKQHNIDCEIQTKLNSDNDLHFSNNGLNTNMISNYNENHQKNLNEGTLLILIFRTEIIINKINVFFKILYKKSKIYINQKFRKFKSSLRSKKEIRLQ